MTSTRHTIIVIMILSMGCIAPFIAVAAQAPFRPAQTGWCSSALGGHCVNLASLTAAVQPVPGLEFLQIDTSSLGNLLASLYVFGLGFIGVAALIMLTYGGIKYMIARDKDPTEAKKYMTNALIGLALALSSWLILYVINPDLVTKLDLALIPINNLGPPPGDGTKLTPPPTQTAADCTKIALGECGDYKNCTPAAGSAGTQCIDRGALDQSFKLPFCNDNTIVAASPGETPPCACKTPNLKPVLENKFLVQGSWNFYDLVWTCKE